jgi:hypothetical protein
MRRKNLHNPVTDGTIDADITTVADNFWGVDLNRNSSQGFGLQNGSSSSVTSLIYRGRSRTRSRRCSRCSRRRRSTCRAPSLLDSDTHSFGQGLPCAAA